MQQAIADRACRSAAAHRRSRSLSSPARRRLTCSRSRDAAQHDLDTGPRRRARWPAMQCTLHQRVAMHADEACAEFLLERAQRILDQVAAAGVAHGGVFLVGGEVVARRPAASAAPVARAAPPGACAPRSRRSRAATRASCVPARRAARSSAAARRLGPHRLEQVADGLRLEGLDRIGVVGGREDDRRGLGQQCHVPRRLQSVHAGHAHVEQHDVGLQLAGQAQRLVAVARPRRRPRRRRARRAARRRRSRAGASSSTMSTRWLTPAAGAAASTCGKRSRTTYSSPWRPASTSARPAYMQLQALADVRRAPCVAGVRGVRSASGSGLRTVSRSCRRRARRSP